MADINITSGNSNDFDRQLPERNRSDSERHVDNEDILNDGGAFQEAPWNEGRQAGNITTSGPITGDYADLINPGTTTLDEEFAGASGIGSLEETPGG